VKTLRLLCVFLFISLSVFIIPPLSNAQGVAYQTKIFGVNNPELKKTLQASSSLIQLKDSPLLSLTGLIRRVQNDEERFQKVLQSFGYFSGIVKIRIAGKPIQSLRSLVLRKAKSFPVAIKVTAGPLYKFGRIKIRGFESMKPKPVVTYIKPGDPALGSEILKEESDLIAQLKVRGYAYASLGKRRLEIDRKKKVMDVYLIAIPGQKIRLGEVILKGNKKVKSDFIIRKVSWQSGDIYNPKIIKSYQSVLSNLGLFASVKVRMPERDKLPKKISKPVQVIATVEEKKMRFVGFGGDYSTNFGAGITGFWGHRNYFGRGEKLKLGSRVDRIGENEFSKINKKLNLEFNKPDYKIVGQELVGEGKILTESFDAFDRDAVLGSIGLSRKFGRHISFTGRAAGEFAEIDDDGVKSEFTLISIPIGLKYDNADDLLNPTKGTRHELGVTPFATVSGDGDNFTIGRLTSRAYFDVTGNKNFVLAFRGSVGGIIGDSTISIPKDKRFFSGGGGSIRGYEFQKVGPLDEELDPDGGRSLIEVSSEFRFRVKQYGLVLFIDGGNVFNDEIPNFDEELQWGAGIGFRYYASFGPARVDIAIPLNKRDFDDSFAFYISLGQAF